MRSSGIFLLLTAAVLTACQGEKAQPEVTRGQAIDIADVYVERNYPMTRRNNLRPVAHDQGTTWLVTYEMPDEDAIGGTPTIEIDKRTRQVVRAHHDQ